MSTLEEVKEILASTLQLGDRASAFDESSGLLGVIPELDSMAVITVITAIEEHYGFTVDDDELTADTFETVGSLTQFVDQKRAG